MPRYVILLRLILMTFGVTLSTTEGSGLEAPVLSTSGDTTVLVLMDIHRSTDQNNVCTDFSTRAAELVFTLEWQNQNMVNNGKGLNPGILVYDTCGDVRRTLLILGYVFNSDNTSISSVISYGSPTVQSNISHFLRPFGILHIHINQSAHVSTQENLNLDIATISPWKIRDILRIVRDLGWNNFAVISSNHPSAIASRDLFLKMSAPYSLCISSAFTYDDVKDYESLPRLVILFVSADDSYDAITSNKVFSNSVVLVAADYWEDLTSNISDIFLYLEHLNTSGNLVQYVKDKIEDMSNNSSVLNSYRKYNGCVKKEETVTCNGQTAVMFLPSRFVGRDIEATVSALSNARNLLTHFDSNNCTGSDLSHCVGFQAVLSGFSDTSRGFIEKYQLVGDSGGELTSYKNRGYITIAEVHKNQIQVLNTAAWDQMKTLSSGACRDDLCVNCTIFPGSLTEKETAVAEGDVNIRLRVPLTKNSPVGKVCNVWDVDGVALAEVFKHELLDIRRRIPDALHNIKLGGVVFDTCQRGSIKNGDIFVDIDYVSDDDVLSYIPAPSGNHFTVSSVGVSLGKPDSSHFVRAAIDLLISLKWTYVSIIFSPEETLLTEFENYPRVKQNNICISNKVAMDENITDIAMKLQKILTKSSGGAFVLLTNAKDTSLLQKVLFNINNAYSGANFITFPWNRDIITHPGTIAILQSQNLVGNAASVMQNLNPYVNDSDRLLDGVHKDKYKCSLTVHPEMIYPDICPATPTFLNITLPPAITSAIRNAVESTVLVLDKYYQDVCPSQMGKCYSMTNEVDLQRYLTAIPLDKNRHTASFKELVTNKDVFIYQGNYSHSSPLKVGSIDINGTVSVDGNEVKTYNADFVSYTAVHQCPDWCPECYRCSSAVVDNNGFYQSGDVVLAAMFPVHKSVASICDALATDKPADMMIDAFLFALASAKDRYPYLLPGIRLGSLLLDTCSDVGAALQTIMNFETCRVSYTDNEVISDPHLLTLYLNADSGDVSNQIQDTVQKYKKVSLSITDELPSSPDDVTSRFYYPYSTAGIRTIVEILNSTQWTYIDIIRSNNPMYDSVVFDLLSACNSFNICVHRVIPIDRYMGSSEPTRTIGVILADMVEIKDFFKSLISIPQDRSFIIGEIIPSWEYLSGFILPKNARILAIERVGKLNSDLITAISNSSQYYKRNPWRKEFDGGLSGCSTPQCKDPTNLQIASKIVFGVDAILHALHKRYKQLCPNYFGVCPVFAKEGVQLQGDHLYNISFKYLDNIQVDFPFKNPDSWAFVIKNFKGASLVDIGNYSDGILHLDPQSIYDTNGRSSYKRGTRCFTNCRCVGRDEMANTTDTEDLKVDPYANMELKFFKSSAELNKELWTIIVLILGVGGSFVSLCFVIYVFHKVCAGFLSKRYVGLGILLLISIVFLFLSVIPFVFTPSRTVCSTRFFIPGFAYTLSFATIMTKIMSLRSYKLIGLGGELSNINQFLTVLFITGIQVAVGVHFWYIEDNNLGFLRTKLNDANDPEYACVFDRTEFVKYLVYVMFLIMLSAIYSIFVRNETKNMGEAKFIMIYSWLCIIVWVSWIVTLLVLPRQWAEVIVCIGILTCATLMTLIVFLPKLHRISRLKYDIKRSGMENGGYKVDPDFMFERPYTLPSTTRTSFKYSEKTNPRFISSFDTSLSY